MMEHGTEAPDFSLPYHGITLRPNNKGMFTKLDLIERIIATTDENVLAKVGDLLAHEKGEFAFTKEHLAQLEERRARRKQGQGKGYSLAEVKAMLKTKKK